jgi:hypothetical protein
MLTLKVRGRHSEWSFAIEGDERMLADWRADGLDVDEVTNVIPAWLPAVLIRPWCWVEDRLRCSSGLR